MTGKAGQLPLTLREWRGVWVPVVVWIVATGVAALTGPFETYERLGALARTGYWALVVGVSVLCDAGFRWLMRGRSTAVRLLARLGFAAVLGGAVHLINGVVFSGWGGWGRWLWLLGVIWAVAMAVEALVALSRHAHGAAPEAEPQEAPDAAFQRRLPHDRRGALIRLEAQDHYLKAVTAKGEALILMRLADAEAELAGCDGLRVHRSHWVARGQVARVLRREGRLVLCTTDGAEVPVSRSYRAEVEAAGLTP
ncbi:LytTR family transcriptional regulator [Thalassobius vesicularis]|uniref:LytTR family transcriptional regulator n=1 Tax=Thalassobius vesicularis TaxID=1294297 RepID=A0A4S3M7U2_9RHOB|nr:LytTR family DNA-binding domain-containing protein [Thalassobius vesicularis]THD72922.1 LytTR family transcriptional regulator [Thalassobius vesicularis]